MSRYLISFFIKLSNFVWAKIRIKLTWSARTFQHLVLDNIYWIFTINSQWFFLRYSTLWILNFKMISFDCYISLKAWIWGVLDRDVLIVSLYVQYFHFHYGSNCPFHWNVSKLWFKDSFTLLTEVSLFVEIINWFKNSDSVVHSIILFHSCGTLMSYTDQSMLHWFIDSKLWFNYSFNYLFTSLFIEVLVCWIDSLFQRLICTIYTYTHTYSVHRKESTPLK